MMTLAEYMRELVLMSRQFGQEEELYPLINMLLRENDNIKFLSLRTVSKGENTKKEEGKIDGSMLYGYASFPDLAILSQDCDLVVRKNGQPIEDQADKLYGCVEAKVINENLSPLKKEIYISKKDCKTALVLAVKKKQNTARIYIEYKCSPVNGITKYNTYEQLDFKNLENSLPAEEQIRVCSCNGTYTEDVLKEKEKYLEKNTALEYIKTKIKEEKENEYVDKGTEQPEVIWNQKYFYRVAGIDEQILGEVLWYGKVLYTNGIVWKYLEIKNGNWGEEIRGVLKNYIGEKSAIGIKTIFDNKAFPIAIMCVEIGNLEDKSIGEDLVELINKIKARESVDLNEVQEKASNNVAWRNEWNRLKYNLAAIDWTGSNVYSQFK